MSSAQASFAFKTDPAVVTAWEELREAFRLAIGAVGLKDAAYRLDVSPSLLSDALAERDRKGVRLEWLPAIILAAPEENALAIIGALARLRRFEVSRSKRVLSDAEKLEALREKLRTRFGAAGLELAAEVDR